MEIMEILLNSVCVYMNIKIVALINIKNSEMINTVYLITIL